MMFQSLGVARRARRLLRTTTDGPARLRLTHHDRTNLSNQDDESPGSFLPGLGDLRVWVRPGGFPGHLSGCFGARRATTRGPSQSSMDFSLASACAASLAARSSAKSPTVGGPEMWPSASR